MKVPSSSIVRATWLALLSPKRLVPILVVCAPLIFIQATLSREPLATPLGIVMCLAFVALAPVSYRVMFPDGIDLSHGAVRVVLYSLVGAGVVLSLGVGVPKLLHLRPTFLTERSSLAVIIAMFLVGGWGLGRDVGFEQRINRLQREAERAQVLALRAHLDPHFLFNTLNAIAEWCRVDGTVAEAAVLKLSQMLRTVLSGVREPLWPLERELELVRMLFDLHLLRDKELFELVLEVPTPLPFVKVPPMSLLTLAENAVKHGPAKGHRGRIVVAIVEHSGSVTLSVENPGPYAGPRPGSDGLPTLERQLHLSTNGNARLSVESVGEDRTRAQLVFPFQRTQRTWP
jgi:two-component system, LytTR family, sensor histidine kinase AlgZ